jgi:hypothetical protein
MSYLADGLSQGFQSGFAAGTQKKRDKKQAEDQKARDVLQGEQQKSLQTERLEADAKRDFENRTWRSGESELDRINRSDEANVDRALRAAELTKRAEAEQADQALKASLYYDQQSRQDEQASVARALAAPMQAEQLRAMKQQNDAYGQPKPLPVPMETLEYDPMDPTGAPKRRITGPLGSLGTITGAAAPAGAKPASVIDSFLKPPAAAASTTAEPAQPAAAAAFPAPKPAARDNGDMQRLLRQFGALPPEQMAAELAAAGIQVNPDALRRPNRTY